MKGQELYELYLTHMQDCTTDDLDSWDDLNIAVKQAWKAFALDMQAAIEEAVVEALPGTEAGQRTDV
jgi:hypothetical protein